MSVRGRVNAFGREEEGEDAYLLFLFCFYFVMYMSARLSVSPVWKGS